MGRRKPQQQILEQKAELQQEGIGVPFFGLPTDSGFDVNFATRLVGGDNNLELGEQFEWETLYSRNLGKRTVFHERSRVTGKARIRSLRNLSKSGNDESSYSKMALALQTIVSASNAHTITAERTALKKLRTHVSAKQWRSYTLTGMFTEFSERSGVYYIFRKVAPTIACRISADEHGVYMLPFVTLCMHPVGYTSMSGTGCLCPTDDIIAHLLLMRSDEHLYWKKASQHQLNEDVSML